MFSSKYDPCDIYAPEIVEAQAVPKELWRLPWSEGVKTGVVLGEGQNRMGAELSTRAARPRELGKFALE